MLKAFGRDSLFSVLAVPLTYSALFYFGFATFFCTLPLFFFTLGVAPSHLTRTAKSKTSFLLLSALALYFGHVLLFAMFVPLYAFTAYFSSMKAIRAVFPLLPALMFLTAGIFSPGSDDANFLSHEPSDITLRWLGPVRAIKFLGTFGLSPHPGFVDDLILISCLLTFILSLLTLQDRRITLRAERDVASWLPFIGLCIYLILPDTVGNLFYLCSRFAVPLCGLSLLIIPCRTLEGRKYYRRFCSIQ